MGVGGNTSKNTNSSRSECSGYVFCFLKILATDTVYSASLQKLWAGFTPSSSCVENNRHREHYKIHVEKPRIQHHSVASWL